MPDENRFLLNRRRLLGFSAASLSTAALAACGGRPEGTRPSSEAPSAPAEPQIVEKVVTVEKIKEVPVEKIVTVDKIKEIPVEVEKRVEVVKTAQTVTLYSGRSEKLVAPILKAFEQSTGIDIRVKYAKSAALAATLMEEGDRSPADVFYAQDPGALGSVESLLDKLPEDLTSRVPAWAQNPNGLWVGITGRARTVVYNTEKHKEADLPDDMWGFTEPSWKGRIGWAPTNSSFQTMVTAMRVLWGEAKAEEWLRGIQANEPIVYPKNTPQVAAAGAGEIDVGFVNHYYLHRALAEKGDSFPARNYHVRSGGAGALIMVSGAGILKTARNPETSAKLLTYLLSDSTQKNFASTTYEYPLVPGVAEHKGVTPLAAIKHPSVSLADLADIKGSQDLLRKVGALA